MKLNNKYLNKKPFIIAEVSANHNGKLENAKKIIKLAKTYGADAVKLQTYTPDTMTVRSNKKDFQIKRGLWKGFTLWDLYNKAQTPFEWQKELFDYAKKQNILCFSTPFDESAVDLLEKINCPFYKISSFEMNHIPLIKKIAKTGKPIIISTGTSFLNEIDVSYKALKKYGAKNITILYCVSNYPSNEEDFNLNNIKILKERYKCRIGFSDHSNDNNIAYSAALAGAEVFEKHIAMNNQKKGFDVKFSSKGKEFGKYVKAIKKSYRLLGKDFFHRNVKENENLKFKRSIYTVEDIKKGQKFNNHNIKVIRPGYGINPLYYFELMNKESPFNLRKHEPLKKNLLKKVGIKFKI